MGELERLACDHEPRRFVPIAVDGTMIPGEFFRCRWCGEILYRVRYGTGPERTLYVVADEAKECGCVPGKAWCRRHGCPDCTEGLCFGPQCEGHAAAESFWAYADERANAIALHPAGKGVHDE